MSEAPAGQEEIDVRLPFAIAVGELEVWQLVGLAYVRSGALVLEYQKETIGFRRSKTDELVIKPRELTSASLRPGFFACTVELTATSMRVFDPLPGTRHNVLPLRVRRRHRADAARLVSRLSYLRAEHVYETLSGRDL